MPLVVLALLAALLPGCAGPGPIGPGDRARIAGRTYVVTGASSGIGRGVARRLAGAGANVVLAARRGTVLDSLVEEIQASGGQALAVPTDVSRPEDVERLAQAAIARFGGIDVWINDAAVAAIGRFEVVPLADHARVVDVNLKCYIFGSHVALQQFRRQGRGTLVNIASVEGRIPLAFHASYAATKSAIIGLDAALAQELRLTGADGIRIATVLPWAVDTPFWDHTANYSGGTPRVYTMDGPDEVVDAVVWVSVHPQKELAVGLKAQASVLGAQIWPGLAERVAGNLIYRSQFSTAPPAPATSGSLFQPMATGDTVEGRARARMQHEDAQRRGQETR